MLTLMNGGPQERNIPAKIMEILANPGDALRRRGARCNPSATTDSSARSKADEPKSSFSGHTLNLYDSAEVGCRRPNFTRHDVERVAAILCPGASSNRIPPPTILKIDVRQRGLDSELLSLVAESISKNSTLTALNVSGNCFPDGIRESKSRAYYLQPDEAQGYELRPSRLGPNAGLRTLSDALMQNSTLRVLDLSESHIEAQGVSCLAEGLRKNCFLQELKLARNIICDVTAQGWGKFTSSGVERLAEALKAHPALQRLDLSRNQLCGVTAPWAAGQKGRFVVEALTILLQSMRMNHTLYDMNLTDNGILEAGGRRLLESFAAPLSRGGAGFDIVERPGRGCGRLCMLRRQMTNQRRPLR